ncbi:MAG: hypothetical protein QXY78_03280 [Thermoplasmata archaeon]
MKHYPLLLITAIVFLSTFSLGETTALINNANAAEPMTILGIYVH